MVSDDDRDWASLFRDSGRQAFVLIYALILEEEKPGIAYRSKPFSSCLLVC